MTQTYTALTSGNMTQTYTALTSGNDSYLHRFNIG